MRKFFSGNIFKALCAVLILVALIVPGIIIEPVIDSLFPMINVNLKMYIIGFFSTITLTVSSTLIAYIIGLPIGVILYGTSSDGIFPGKNINFLTGFVVNMIRSVPFIILLIMIQPLAKLVVGTKLGNLAFVFYLVFSATPYVARMVESSLREVDRGVIEAAQSMGSNNFQIITKVLIPEAKPSLLVGAAIAMTTILGYTPMTYLVAGDGLGQLAIQYGLYRFDYEIMYVSSILIVILVQVFQESITALAKHTDRRIRNKMASKHKNNFKEKEQ